MTTYNGEKFVLKQVQSILSCLSGEDELIISDDGSIDNTLSIIRNIKDNRIKILHGPHKGINKNFENAILHCKGDFIFLSDQDDEWLPNKITETLKCFFTHNPILIMHDAVVLNDNELIIDKSFFAKRKVKHGVISNILKGSYHGCCIAFSRKLLPYIIPIPRAGFYHDQWIGILAEIYFKPFFLKKTLIKYYRRDNNSSTYEKCLPLRKQITNRIQLIELLIKHIRNNSKMFN